MKKSDLEKTLKELKFSFLEKPNFNYWVKNYKSFMLCIGQDNNGFILFPSIIVKDTTITLPNIVDELWIRNLDNNYK